MVNYKLYKLITTYRIWSVNEYINEYDEVFIISKSTIDTLKKMKQHQDNSIKIQKGIIIDTDLIEINNVI